MRLGVQTLRIRRGVFSGAALIDVPAVRDGRIPQQPGFVSVLGEYCSGEYADLHPKPICSGLHTQAEAPKRNP